MARQLKAFLAQQIRALRGDHSQTEFGELIGKPQSVVSRLENQADRQISIQTLIDIAERLDIAVIVRFVDFATFLRYTEDNSDAALAPASYSQLAIEQLAAEQSVSRIDSIPTMRSQPRDLPIPEEPRSSDPQVTTAQIKTGPLPLRVIDGGKRKPEPQPVLPNRRWAIHQFDNPLPATGS